MRSLGLRLLVTLALLFVLALLFAVSLAAAVESHPKGAPSRAPQASETAEPPAAAAASNRTTASAPSAQSPLTGTPDSTSFLGAGSKLLVASLALAGLLYLAMRVVRRLPISRFLPSAEGPIRLVARTHLGSRESLCLLEVGTTRLLVGISAQGMETLHVWPERAAGSDASLGAAPAASRSTFDIRVPGQLRALQARVPGARR